MQRRKGGQQGDGRRYAVIHIPFESFYFFSEWSLGCGPEPNPATLIRDQAPRGGVPAARRGVPDQAGHDGSVWQVSLIWNEGMLGAFERALPWSVVKLDAIVRGFLGTNALSRFSRAPAPVMQYGGALAGPAGATGSAPTVQIQGETLRTWAFKSPAVEKVQVELGTEGRPLEATVEVWNAAGNTPVTPLRATTQSAVSESRAVEGRQTMQDGSVGSLGRIW